MERSDIPMELLSRQRLAAGAGVARPALMPHKPMLLLCIISESKAVYKLLSSNFGLAVCKSACFCQNKENARIR